MKLEQYEKRLQYFWDTRYTTLNCLKHTHEKKTYPTGVDFLLSPDMSDLVFSMRSLPHKHFCYPDCVKS